MTQVPAGNFPRSDFFEESAPLGELFCVACSQHLGYDRVATLYQSVCVGVVYVSSLALRLKVLIDRTGKSITEVATSAGLSKGYVARILTGEREHPALESLIPLAKVLRTTPTYLQTGDPAVNITTELLNDPGFKQAGVSSPARRLEFVLYLASYLYSGHLRLEDIATYLGLTYNELRSLLKAGGAVADDLLVKTHQLTGTPLAWLRLGAFSFLPQELLGDWEEVERFMQEYMAHRPTKL